MVTGERPGEGVRWSVERYTRRSASRPFFPGPSRLRLNQHSLQKLLRLTSSLGVSAGQAGDVACFRIMSNWVIPVTSFHAGLYL